MQENKILKYTQHYITTTLGLFKYTIKCIQLIIITYKNIFIQMSKV